LSQSSTQSANLAALDDRQRQDSGIATVELLASQYTHFRDGPMRSTDAQEMSDGQDLLLRLGGCRSWLDSETAFASVTQKSESSNAAPHQRERTDPHRRNGDELLPGILTAQDALANLRKALVNPQAAREAPNQFRALRRVALKLSPSSGPAFYSWLMSLTCALKTDKLWNKLWNKITLASGYCCCCCRSLDDHLRSTG
jgi:hypothetical protein